ncbi:hypothetical protein GW12_29070 [Acinetobacter sp. HR7]|nr:hypothetical protein GW12_29070 [Acinetobacter sp. HR7]
MYLLNRPKEQFTHPFEVLRNTRTLENVLATLYVIFVLLISLIAIIMPIG